MLGECDAGIILQIETHVGAKCHGELEYTEFGQLAAMSMRLMKPWHHTNRAYAADSWFMAVIHSDTSRFDYLGTL
eukprot:5464211-Pleurochrysis_carterae.AAC.1